MSSILVPESFVKHNTKVKVYPDGTFKIVCCSHPIFKDDGYQLVSTSPLKSRKYDMSHRSRPDSIKRAKETVYDLIKLNDFTYWVTLTLDSTKISSRYDSNIVKKALLTWLKNMQQRNDLTYLLIPEHHKDGAIHMHMLCSGNLDLVPTNICDKGGRQIYNLSNWKYGFSEVVKLDGNKDYTARYVTKYVTKDSDKIFGKYYYSGGSLNRKVYTVLEDVDFFALDNLKAYTVDGTSIMFRYPSVDDIEKIGGYTFNG